MRATAQHTFFFSDRDIYSNWYMADFEVDGKRFSCGEQWMMYAKAMVFGDEDTAQRILQAKTPKEHKALGREVKGFDKAIWDTAGMSEVRRGLFEKFRQDVRLRDELLSTAGTTLVEASPWDKIWGVGLGENDPRIDIEANWTGENRLGNMLTGIRDELALEVAEHPSRTRLPGL